MAGGAAERTLPAEQPGYRCGRYAVRDEHGRAAPCQRADGPACFGDHAHDSSLEIMHTIHRASDQGQHIQLQSTCDRPAPLGQPEWKMLD